MPLADWQSACTLHIEAVEMTGINPSLTSIVTSPLPDLPSEELISLSLPHDEHPTQALDIASNLLFNLAHDEDMTEQHEIETLLDMTEQASSSSSSVSSMTPVNVDELRNEQQHMLDGFDI